MAQAPVWPSKDQIEQRTKKAGGSPEAAGKRQHALASQTTFIPWLPARSASTTRILYNHNTTA
jgi:hypothetical protein